MTSKRVLSRTGVGGVFCLLILLFLVMLLWRQIVITIPAGHAGVLWWRFLGGTDVGGPPSEEGTHFIWPWDKFFIYDARLQEQNAVFDVVTVDGLNIGITASIRWRVIEKNLGRLHKTIGPEYVGRLLFPEVGSVLRETISKYRAEDLYSHDRRSVQDAIYHGLINKPNGIGGGPDLHEREAANGGRSPECEGAGRTSIDRSVRIFTARTGIGGPAPGGTHVTFPGGVPSTARGGGASPACHGKSSRMPY